MGLLWMVCRIDFRLNGSLETHAENRIVPLTDSCCMNQRKKVWFCKSTKNIVVGVVCLMKLDDWNI